MGQIFVSHASADRVAAEGVAEALRRAGHELFLDSDPADGITPGADWQRVVRRELRACDVVVFLNSQAGQRSMWCHSELVLASELGKPVYSLDLEPGLEPHPLLRAVQGVAFAGSAGASAERLADSLAAGGLAGGLRAGWLRGRPPYPGLAALDMADAGVFFGRDDEVRALIARVDRPLGRSDGNLVVVLGPSGAGKSSLVRAGLAARLAPRGSGWAVARPFEPGLAPLARLARALAALAPTGLSEDECLGRLRGEGLAVLGEQLAARAGFTARRLLVVVDQAGQLAAVTPPTERDEFAAVLGSALVPGSPVTVVLTARSDRLAEIQQLPELGPAVRSPFVISPLPPSRLPEVIEGPARRAGLTFAPGLASRIAADAARGGGDTADALPLLAFTLREMYDRLAAAGRDYFTTGDYELTGRIEGAITQRTGQAEESLPVGSDPVLDRLLPRFVTIAPDREPATRPVPRSRLTAAEQAVVAVLEDQRLVTGTSDLVRLAHERLITAWPRLAAAVTARRDDLVLQARLERQAQEWEDGAGGLPGREATVAAAAWLATRADPGTSRTVVGYYIRAAQRAARWQRVRAASALALITALAIAATVIAVIAVRQRSDALRQSRIAQSEALAAQAISLANTNVPLAMLLSLQAYKTAPTLQARFALAWASGQPLQGVLASGEGIIGSVAFRPDGMALAAGDTAGHVSFWNIATGQHPTLKERFAPKDHIGVAVNSIAISPDGKTIAAGDTAGHVSLWNIATGHLAKTLTDSGGVAINSIAISPDGKTIAAGDSIGDVSLWNIATGHPAKTLTDSGGIAINSIAISPDGKTIVAGDSIGDVSLWNIATGHPAKTLTDSGGIAVNSIAISADGKTIVAGDSIGHVSLWNIATGRLATTLAVGSPVWSVAFSADGKTIAAGDSNGDVSLWNVALGQRAALAEDSPVWSIAFSPDGKTIAAGDSSGDVSLWSVLTGQRTPLKDGSTVLSVAFSPDGKYLASGDLNGHAILWNMATRRPARTLNDRKGGAVLSVAFSPNSKILATGDLNGHVSFWTVATGQRTTLTDECGQCSTVYTVAFSPDGKTLAVGDLNGHVILWNTATRQRAALLADSSTVDTVAFSPDGKTLAVGDSSGHVSLWDVTAARRTAPLVEQSMIITVSFRGEILVAGDYVGDISIWNASSRKLFARLAEGSLISPAQAYALSPDGRLIAAVKLGGGMELLHQNLSNLGQGHLEHLICGEVRANLTRAEWAQYAPGQPYQKTCPAYRLT